MPADVGRMFTYGPTPWPGEGASVAQPLTVDEALAAAGLEWDVGTEPVVTAHTRLGTDRRVALVRWEKGLPVGVVGVVPPGHVPLRNREGADAFDAIFGRGRRVYYAGGYLGIGEMVWLLAKMDDTILVGDGDRVDCHALYASAYGGGHAGIVSLLGIRAVCQSVVRLALPERGLALAFRSAHRMAPEAWGVEAEAHRKAAVTAVGLARAELRRLAGIACTPHMFLQMMEGVMPMPREPRDPASDLTKAAYSRRRERVAQARQDVETLRMAGKGADLATGRGTLWGAISAFAEYYDHYAPVRGSRLAYSLFGAGARQKRRAYELALALARVT